MKANRQTTLKSLAEKMGVSVSTVSRVLSGQGGKYRISKKTQAAILAEAERLDFAPNQLARGLRLKKTHTLGLMIPDISNPFFSSLARQIEMEARKNGYAIFLFDSEERTEIEVESLKLMKNRRVDGVIISPVGQSGEHLEALKHGGMPIVIVDRFFPGSRLPYVTSDNFKGAYEGVRYLIEQGHRRIACLQGIADSSPNMERVRGYCAALEEKGIDVDRNLIVGDHFGQMSGYVGMKLLLGRKEKPTGVFSLGNLISFGALQAIREEGLTVPGDVSLVSFDEQPYSAFLATPLTTIAQQTEGMGKVAVNMLMGQINGSGYQGEAGIMLPTELIKRESVRKIAVKGGSKQS